jgi:hypothetical protein
MAISPILEALRSSALYLVWYGMVIVKRIGRSWMDALSDERFDTLCGLMLYPRISGGVSKADLEFARELDRRYEDIAAQIESVMGRSATGK